MENRRKSFRTLMFNQKCIVSNDYNVSDAFIVDLSDSGMGLEVKADYFFEECQVEFKVMDKEYLKNGKILRKKLLPNGNTFYAIQFRQTDKERQDLFGKLLQLEAIRNRQNENK